MELNQLLAYYYAFQSSLSAFESHYWKLLLCPLLYPLLFANATLQHSEPSMNYILWYETLESYCHWLVVQSTRWSVRTVSCEAIFVINKLKAPESWETRAFRPQWQLHKPVLQASDSLRIMWDIPDTNALWSSPSLRHLHSAEHPSTAWLVKYDHKGGEPGTNSHVISWHDDITAIMADLHYRIMWYSWGSGSAESP